MAPVLDLAAELAEGAETAKNAARDSIGAGAGPDVDAYLGRTSASVPPRTIAQIKRAVRMMDGGDAVGAAKLVLKLLDRDPDVALANQVMAMALERLGRLSKALEFYERAWRLDPRNADLYQNLGLAAWKLDMLSHAEKFLRIYAEMAPDQPSGAINLAGCLRDQGRYEDAIEILRLAIYRDETNAQLWNALGTVVLESGDPVQACTFYEEALRVHPGFARAHHNLAHALEMQGELEASIRHYDQALTAPASRSDEVTMRHARALSLLGAGRLKEGWEAYETRLDPDYHAAVAFSCAAPRWDGDDLDAVRGKRVLVVGEQGVGDEVMMSTAMAELAEAVGPDGAVGLVCENRLIGLFERSFPFLESVHRHYTTTIEGRPVRGWPDADAGFRPDAWAPMGALMRAFRSDPAAFAQEGGHLTPDPARVADFAARLAVLPEGLKVGFCWKSKLMTAKRAKYFSPFEAWTPLLKTPGLVFVNLQYGDTDAEIARCAREHGVTIHTIDGLDLMNDLDGVAALGAALDAAAGPMNASAALAASAGCPVHVVNGQPVSWTQFGTARLPWLPTVRLFSPSRFRDWKTPMSQLARTLAEAAGARAAA